MYSNNIVTGIHYRSAHDMIAYSKQQYSSSLEKTNQEKNKTISIPFHENLTDENVELIIKLTKEFKYSK